MTKVKKKESLSLEEKLEQALIQIDEQPYKVPENWCWTYLTSGFCECKDSFRKPINASGRAEREGDVPYYGATGQVGWINDYLTDEQLVLVGEDGAPFLDTIKDKAYMIEGKAWVNNHAHILKSYYGEIGNKFILHYLNSFNYKGYVNGTTRLKLTQASMSTIPVPMPPLAEQQRIVEQIENMFAKLDEAKEKAQESLDGFQTRIDSILHKAFSGDLSVVWRNENGISSVRENVIFRDILDVRDGTHDSPQYYDEGYPLVTSKNLKNGCITDKDIKYISKEDFDQINQRSKVDVGDILFAMIGTIGNPVVIEDEPNYAIKNVALFKNKGKVNPYFIKYYLESREVRDKMQKEAKGTTQKFVSLGYLRDFPIAIPSDLEQEYIVKKLDELLSKELQAVSIIEEVIEQIDLMKKSVLAKAFRGELGTNESEDESSIELLKSILEK